MRALKQSVRVDKLRLAHLKKTPPRPTLLFGSHGADVTVLQKFLRVYGVYAGGDTEGVFGPKTREAVRAFQAKEFIVPSNGMVGPKTWVRMLDISNKKITKRDATASKPAIVGVAFTNAVAENGSPRESQNVFASTTPVIYAVVELKDASQETAIGYIRYYRKSYIDSHVSHPSRNGLKYFHFQWTLKDGARRPAGDYSITFYVNGKKAVTKNISVF